MDVYQAVDLILRCLPHIPFWPQLPKRDIREGMVSQFIESFPCLKISRQGLTFDAANKEHALERFYDRLIANDVDYFAISPDFALGLHTFYQELKRRDIQEVRFIKCHITGPFTFAASLRNEDGVSLLHDPIFMQVIIKGLMMKAMWQIRLFEEFGKEIIIFIDEPYLACFGSAYTPINREQVLEGLSELTDGIKKYPCLIGVHCCGNTDWSLFTEVKGIDIINFDAFGFLDKFLLYAPQLKHFLDRDGILCWGVVPTQEYTQEETVQRLAQRIEQGIDTFVKKGISREMVTDNLLVSPSCGLGALDEVRAVAILQALSATSTLLRKMTAG
jgi:methionine synthase II (cobalamin-independent)